MSVTIHRASRRFLLHCRAVKGLSPLTICAYRTDLKDFGASCRARVVTDVKRDEIRRYAREQLESGLMATTVRRRLSTIRLLFGWLEREELVPLSVFHRL